MTERGQVYKCRICGTVAEIVSPASGIPVCCGEPMRLCKANSGDGAGEKHVPEAEPLKDGGIKVRVGSDAHPMEPEHYIQWIEVINGTYVNRKYLKPGDRPEAVFYVDDSPQLIVREYCSKHGLWQKF